MYGSSAGPGIEAIGRVPDVIDRKIRHHNPARLRQGIRRSSRILLQPGQVSRSTETSLLVKPSAVRDQEIIGIYDFFISDMSLVFWAFLGFTVIIILNTISKKNEIQ